jgi:aminoglycoside phosphotransferase family enzyme/predicted kinase
MPAALPQLLIDLQRREAYDHPVDRVELVQTHISFVLLAGDYAYKLKKPLDLGFLDYTTLDRRRFMCEEEVRLNRRLCDDVYLGLVPVTRGPDGRHRFGGDGRPMEYAVRMRRVSQDSMMPALLASGGAGHDRLASLARKIADFHRAAARGAGIAKFGRASAVRANWEENFVQVAPFLGKTLAPNSFEAVRGYVERFLDEHGHLIDERARNGRVRDGHGDLRADSVVFNSDGSVCVMDCIEFNDRLRYADVASDVAFLAMDLEFRGYRDEADQFLSLYLEALGPDDTLPVVLGFYVVYRAFIRGKVDSMQASEREVPSSQRAEARRRARAYFRLADAHARRRIPPCVVMMVGLSGTGKSYVARSLACRIGAALLSTDVIRRELTPSKRLGVSPYGEAAYSSSARARVYADMIERAAQHLAQGRSVVLDATFLTRDQRAQALSLAVRSGTPLLAVEVTAAVDVVRARLAARAALPGAPDARWDTYLAQRDAFEPLDDIDPARVLSLDSEEPLGSMIDAVCHRIDALHRVRLGRSAG